MNLFEVTNNRQLESVPMPSSEDFRTRYIATRTPVILDSVADELKFTRDWDLNYFQQKLKTVRVHKPDRDGVYHFLSYQRIPFSEFVENLNNEKTMYSLEPLIGSGAPQGSKEDRADDFDDSAVPSFIGSGKLRNSNLYIGPGSNKTLLHFDEVNSLLIMVEGEKRFIVYRPSQTKNVYPYGVFNLRSILEHRVLDSKVNPVNLDIDRFPRLKNAIGWEGTIKAGQALFIPAGTWHFIESDDRNIAVNYFWHDSPLAGWFQRPLSEFWLKRRQVVLIDFARRVRDMFKSIFAPA